MFGYAKNLIDDMPEDIKNSEWGQQLLEMVNLREPGPKPASASPASIINYESLDSLIERLNGRVVWLDPIEMYSRNGNPIVALITRILEASTNYGVTYSDSDYLRGGLLCGFNDIEQDLSVLMGNAAIAFPGNLQERRAMLDPDCYAAESMRVELCRVGFLDRFKDIMKKVCDMYHRRRVVRFPIFALTFLDYDVHFTDQQPFIDVIQHYLTDEIEVFVVGDGDLPTLRVHRNRDKFHVLTSDEFNRVRRESKSPDRW